MSSARVAAVVSLVYAAGFGGFTIPVAVYLLRRGRLPRFFDLFDMYGGPWSGRVSDGTFVVLLMGFLVITSIVAWTAVLAWRGSRFGAGLNLALVPVEFIFWTGFALPLPWLIAVARVVFIAMAWKSLGPSRARTSPTR